MLTVFFMVVAGTLTAKLIEWLVVAAIRHSRREKYLSRIEKQLEDYE